MGIIIKMRFFFACIIAMTAATPVVEDSLAKNTAWAIDGIKGYYDGYYSSFYKTSLPKNMEKCLDEDSIKDVVAAINILADPLAIFTQCTKNPGECMFNKLMENLTKNMFVLVGKVTSLAETFQGFPAQDGQGFKEQMKELGQDAGTWVRVIFNFKKEENN